MSFINWERRYEIGVDYVDRQHKQLVDIINCLHDSVESGTSERALDRVFADLEVYTETHFKDEEDAMEENNYPGLALHRKAHQDFILRVQQMREHLMAQEVLAEVVLGYLKNWLTLHIMGTDRQCAAYLARGGLGKAAGD